jgi:hypothetical protein
MAMDVPDTDFSVTLYEILSDGSSVQLTGDEMRARYRESHVQAKLVKPGQIASYDFEGFTWFSRRVSKGSRLCLVLNCINSSSSEKNYNSGGDLDADFVRFRNRKRGHLQEPGWPSHLPFERAGCGLLESCDSDGLVVVDIEDGVELGQLKQVMNLLAQVQQFELSAMVLGRGVGGDQFT